MALQETGLGWYADSDWLADQSGVIAEVTTGGGSNAFGTGGDPGEDWIMTIGGTGIYNANIEGSISYWAYLSGVFSVEGRGWTNGSVMLGTPGARYWVGTNIQRTYAVTIDDQTWYYATPYFNQTLNSADQKVTTLLVNGMSFATVQALLEYVYNQIVTGGGTTSQFTKTSNAYSVTCLVKWREELGGEVYVSPVLISTENSATFWEINDHVPTQSLTEHTFQGENFFMRLAKLYDADDYSVSFSNFPVLDYSESAPLSSDLLFALIAAASELGVGYPPQDEDPYGPGGTSGPSQPNGDFDFDSDTIPDSPLPTYSFAASGFCRIYNPNLSQLSALANYMWTDQTFLQTVINHLKQLLENPVDAVISLSMLPISIPNGSAEEVKIMYIPTRVYMPPAIKQIVDVDCGSVYINEAYGSALDYNPYTKVSMFLPFIGMVDLDTDEVMNHTLYVKYRVDIVSGACTAKILVDGGSDEKCLYQFSGDCSISMPLNSADFSAYRAAFIQAAKAVMTGIGAAGAAIDAAIADAVVESQTSGAATGVSASEGALIPVPTQALDASGYRFGNNEVDSPAPAVDYGKFGDVLMGVANNTVGMVTSGKLSFQHASGFSGNSGILGVRRPFVVIKRPDMANPANYGSYNGRPCSMYLSLGPLRGFTQMQRIHLTGFSATNPELSEIGEFLKNGVIL